MGRGGSIGAAHLGEELLDAGRVRDALIVAELDFRCGAQTQREPLFAIYDVAACGSVRDALARDIAVWRWQDELGAVEADFSGRAADFRNLNTLDELQLWERDHGG